MKSIYVIGSLRNPQVPVVANALRKAGFDAFDAWYSAGPCADDSWKTHEESKGSTLKEALKGWAAQNVFQFDRRHLDRCAAAVLVLPAGVSGHLELGRVLGSGKPGYVLFPPEGLTKLPPDWRWVAGIYEGEGTITCSRSSGKYYPRLSIGMTDRDVLEKVAKITGVAAVSGPYTRRSNSFGKKPIYFWQPGKLEDIILVLRGIWPDLSMRRKAQIIKVLTKCGVGDDLKYQGKPPYEFRWDVMYNFATDILSNIDEMVEVIANGL